MEQGCLIDSNVIIGYLNNKIPTDGMQFLHLIIEQVPNISVINKIEVLRFDSPNKETYLTLVEFVNECSILNLNDSVINLTISICKANRIKLPDAIIAATAITFDLILLTRNITDFKTINNLKTLNPWEITDAETKM